nr:tetratricopeptide repeat protein [Actinomycetales bacterium]
MTEDPTTPGHTVSVRELLGLPPDADEATVAVARARLLAILTQDEPDGGANAPAAPDASPAAEVEGAPAVVEEIADADGAVDPLAEIGEVEDRRPGPTPQLRPGTRAAARRTAKKWAPPVTIAAVIGLVFAVQQFGNSPTPLVEPTAAPTSSNAEAPGPVATAAPPVLSVDAAAVAEQEALLAEDPDNPEVLRTLADLHFDGSDFEGAAEWGERLVEVSPEDAEAYLMLGVSRFNLVDLEGAQAAWETVIELDPESATAHYNLGFLYWSLEPPDLEAAQLAWERVIELSPDSDMAANVEPHLTALQNMDS